MQFTQINTLNTAQLHATQQKQTEGDVNASADTTP